MEAVDAERIARPDGDVGEQLDREGRRIVDGRVTEARRVEPDEVASVEGWMQTQIGIVLLRRAETVEADERRSISGPSQTSDLGVFAWGRGHDAIEAEHADIVVRADDDLVARSVSEVAVRRQQDPGSVRAVVRERSRRERSQVRVQRSQRVSGIARQLRVA